MHPLLVLLQVYSGHVIERWHHHQYTQGLHLRSECALFTEWNSPHRICLSNYYSSSQQAPGKVKHKGRNLPLAYTAAITNNLSMLTSILGGVILPKSACFVPLTYYAQVSAFVPQY